MKGISQFMLEIDAVSYEYVKSIHVIYTDLFCFQASTALCILCHLYLQLNKKCCASENHLNPVRLLTGDPAVTDRGGDGPDSHWGNLSMRGSWLQRQPNTNSVPKGVTKRCCLSWLTNSALVYGPKCGGGGGFAESREFLQKVYVAETSC